MLGDSNLKYVISNLGWVDKGNLWVYNSEKNEVENFKLSDAQYLSIHKGKNNYFSIAHNFNDSRFEVTLHHFSDPAKVICKWSFSKFNNSVNGDSSLLCYIPKFYLASLNLNNEFKFHLFRIENTQLSFSDDKIEWYYNGNFDFGYQGIIGVTEFKDELIFCVQRDGSLYRYSLISNEIIDKIPLANRNGNPKVTFCDDFSELWVDDYDTLLKINPNNWKVVNSRLLQEAVKGIGQFIGSYSLYNNLIVIPRPNSSDILILKKDMTLVTSIKLGNQPLEAVILDKLIVARDWKTGILIIKDAKNLIQNNNPKRQKVNVWTKLISRFKRK